MDLDCSDVNQCKGYGKGIGRPVRIFTPISPETLPIYNTSLYALKQFQFSFYVLVKDCEPESPRHQLSDSKGFPHVFLKKFSTMSDMALFKEYNFYIVNLEIFFILT